MASKQESKRTRAEIRAQQIARYRAYKSATTPDEVKAAAEAHGTTVQQLYNLATRVRQGTLKIPREPKPKNGAATNGAPVADRKPIRELAKLHISRGTLADSLDRDLGVVDREITRLQRENDDLRAALRLAIAGKLV